MGTNYYWLEDICPCCGKPEKELHIGKSSAGWYFSLHIIPEEKISNLKDWNAKWSKNNGKIKDEYGNDISVETMLKIITEREGNVKPENVPAGYKSWDEFHRINYSTFGDRGLLKCKVDGKRCIENKESGTWDLIIGEFS